MAGEEPVAEVADPTQTITLPSRPTPRREPVRPDGARGGGAPEEPEPVVEDEPVAETSRGRGRRGRAVEVESLPRADRGRRRVPRSSRRVESEVEEPAAGRGRRAGRRGERFRRPRRPRSRGLRPMWPPRRRRVERRRSRRASRTSRPRRRAGQREVGRDRLRDGPHHGRRRGGLREVRRGRGTRFRLARRHAMPRLGLAWQSARMSIRCGSRSSARGRPASTRPGTC